MLLFADKARSVLTGSVTSAAGQVAAVTAASGALFVGVGGVATSATNPMRCVLTAVDGNGNDTGSYEVAEITRSGDNLTLVTRGLEGTAAAAWPIGTVIECRPTAGVAMRAPGLIARGVGGSTQGLSSTWMNNSNTANSIMPGKAVLTFPAGTFNAGDMIVMRGCGGHRGTTIATDWGIGVSINLFFSASGGPSSFGKACLWEFRMVIVAPATIQTTAFTIAGGGFTVYPMNTLALNLATTALTLDVQGAFASTPAGDEYVYNDFYEVEIHPATLP